MDLCWIFRCVYMPTDMLTVDSKEYITTRHCCAFVISLVRKKVIFGIRFREYSCLLKPYVQQHAFEYVQKVVSRLVLPKDCICELLFKPFLDINGTLTSPRGSTCHFERVLLLNSILELLKT